MSGTIGPRAAIGRDMVTIMSNLMDKPHIYKRGHLWSVSRPMFEPVDNLKLAKAQIWVMDKNSELLGIFCSLRHDHE